jgi:multiple sugar transport system ATP-binding protein
MTMGTRIAVMKEGVLQQVDSPQVLYDTPANVFVAGFMGSPAMNFIDAMIIEKDGKVAIDCKDFVLEVPEDRADVYRPYVDKEVIFGIRPEDTHDAEYIPPGIKKAEIEAKVDVTELMGAEVVVYLVTEQLDFLGRFDPRTSARVGDKMAIAFNMDHMHIFDKETELAIR